MALGFRRAGIEFDMAIDYDNDARSSYSLNMGHVPENINVKTTFPSLVRRLAKEKISLLVADPPCVSWSYSGKKEGMTDPRDCLMETCALIARLKPKAWLLANVPGLDSKKNIRIVDDLIKPLPGYCSYARLNAADFGVPQIRRRPFWVGFQSERARAEFRWPTPSHAKEAWVTCRQALGHLPLEGLGRPIVLRWNGPDHRPSCADEPAKTLSTNPNSDGAVLVAERDRHKPNKADAPGACVTTGARAGKGGNTLEWPWDRPSTTVQSDPRLGLPGHHDPEIPNSQHGPNAIVLSEKARLILQGFPEDWIVCGKTKGSRDSQIGQAMPPAMAEAVAREIARVMRWNR